jgi:hypothetical protein
MQAEEIDVRPTWRDDLDVSLRRVRAAIVGGFLAGVLVGGVGGRVAMLILRLTSTPAVRGLESDDGFVIGQISTATVFLLILTGVLGAAGGLVYLAVRSWIPPRWRVAVAAVVAGAIGGALVVDPVGLDFTVLGPLSLAVAMFVLLPAAYGALMSAWVERRLGAEQPPSTVAVWVPCVLFALAIALTGPTGVAILTAAAIAWILHRRVPALGAVWRSTPVAWLGRALLAAVTGLAAFRLVAAAVDIL